MEVVTDNEAPTQIRPGQSHEIGRAQGVDSSDKTISRRHLSLSVAGAIKGEEARLQFEVLGRNPIYVYRNNEVKIFRRFERGEMGNGDMFCVSGKNPIWYSVRRIEGGAERVRRNVAESDLAGEVESDFEFKGVNDWDQLDLGVDISGLDSVKEFGFLVEGLEFDSYPKKMMRDIKNWDWFIGEEGRNGDDDDDEGKKVKGKRKRRGENGDDEWSGESEDERVLMEKSRKAGRVKYVTRSKDRGEQSKMSSTRPENRDVDDEDEDNGDGDDDEDDDEDDETLGGFVVDDQNLEEEGDELEEEEEEEEEDFEDEDEDE